MKLSLAVCDVCQGQRKDTKNYRLTSDGRVAVLDLCAEDGKAVEKLFTVAPTVSAPAPSAPGQRGGRGGPRKGGIRRRTPISSMEKIEAIKRARAVSS